jgi:hypothetical protein
VQWSWDGAVWAVVALVALTPCDNPHPNSQKPQKTAENNFEIISDAV